MNLLGTKEQRERLREAFLLSRRGFTNLKSLNVLDGLDVIEKALDVIDLIAQTEDVGDRLVVLNELEMIAPGDVANVPHPLYGTFGKSEVIRGLVRAALRAMKGE